MENTEVIQEKVLESERTEVLNPLIWEFKRPYNFEGKEYAFVDLNKLENWTCDDLIKVSKKYNKFSGGDNSFLAAIVPEANNEYNMFLAAEVTGLPIEFFKNLPARELGTLRAKLISFFLG
jgi:hypothetical protein